MFVITDLLGHDCTVVDVLHGSTGASHWFFNPGGCAVTVATSNKTTADPRAKVGFFVVEPNGSRLGDIANL
jgi:hypothetical protein